ncbi:DinB family protein [Paenibacillus alba]|uniref:DinB family protein n=1 Tax=Paenibacillus alba TaxID=1197127 RepID=UPI00156511A5|nr:DinB family protein [Paenibacillus alba]NQX71103.1 DinB family protein [Paenibacillus alba]
MESLIFNQLAFARKNTLRILEGVTESDATRIPENFRNHILWHAGHIYLVQERFAFMLHGFDGQLPESFMALFAAGTTPLTWTETPPSMSEVIEGLGQQKQRIQLALADKLADKAPSPYTTSSGFRLETIGEFLNFTLYHEGMHISTIKHYKMLLSL